MKNIPIFIFYLVLNFTIFSSYNYILNFIDFRNFIAPISFQIEHKPDSIIYNFITLSKSFIHSKTGFIYDERTTGFSILGVIIILPTIIVSFLNFLKKNKKYKIISLFTISAFLNFILLSSSMTYFKYSVRFFVVYVAICAFSFSFFYKKRLNIYKIAITCICAVNLVLYPLYSTRCPLYCYLKADFKNLKEDLILNKQNVNMLKFQYMILKEFEQKFKKEDKIVILNNDGLYEIIRLPDYNIKTVSFDYIKNSNLKDFDYIITLGNEQTTDSPKHLTLEGVNKDYTYNIATKKYKNKNYIIAKKYIFNDSFFEKKGFKLTEKTVLFKTYKKCNKTNLETNSPLSQ